MRTLKQSPLITFIIALFAILHLASTRSAASCGEWSGRITSLQGEAQVMRSGTSDWAPLGMAEELFAGDKIRVGALSRVAVYLCSDATLRLDQNSTVTFPGKEEEGPRVIRLMEGLGHFFSRTPRSLDFTTPAAGGAVESAEFLVSAASDRTQVTVFEGRVTLSNEAGSLPVDAGKRGLAMADSAPELVPVKHPRDALIWALYYPPVMEVNREDFPGASQWQIRVRDSIDRYRQGQLTQALNAIAALPGTIDDPLFYTYRAMLFTALGRIHEAGADLKKALAIQPAYARAFALKSVTALAQNNKTTSREWADKAVAADPNAPAAHIALSYVNQKDSDLKSALANVREAVSLAPESGLARARHAELWHYLGNLDKAESARKRAAALHPYLSRPHTIMGFIHLADFETRMAEETFEIAIQLDPSAPLPRLGMGLAKIKAGDLKEGRRQMEIAVSLDPDNALLRSYLGKAYYDEKRGRHSDGQLSAAKTFDPDDPTPWIYDALRKQNENRPAEAFQDLQGAMARNNHTTAFRSRLRLDEDRAVRSAGFSRIYQDLGFDQLALSEGFKSVNANPADHSAHRFLADNYGILPRNENARASEVLQSQLLQPINTTPVSPRLGETFLSIHRGTGPSDPSYNAYSDLIERDRPAAQLSGMIGEDGTWGDDIAVSALHENISLSGGQYHYETDGFRKNSDNKINLYNAFGQVALDHKTNVQAEYRYNDVSKGYLPQVFDLDNVVEALRQKDREHTIRGGFKHGFSPGSDLIGSLIYGEKEIDVNLTSTISLPPPIGPLDSDMYLKMPIDIKGYVAELQHLLTTDRFNLISGGGYYHSKEEDGTDITFNPEFPPILTNRSTMETNRADHAYLYFYPTFRLPHDFAWTVGFAADFFEHNQFKDKRTFSPKLGMTWTPTPKTTVRAAIFHTYARYPISRQTIEPTQVAGFTQFEFGGTGMEAWDYGVGVDQKFSDTLFGGFELTGTDREIPYIHVRDNNSVKESDEHFDLYRFYLSMAPMNQFSVNLEYLYERYIGGDQPLYDAKEVTTHRVPITLNLFLPKGFTLFTTTTFVSQRGEFYYPDFEKDDDRFWYVDAGLRYRLPRRFGIASIEAKNLFNESFKFLETDMANPSHYPEQLIMGKVTLAF